MLATNLQQQSCEEESGQREKRGKEILEDARNMKKFVPNSFLSSDLIPKEGFNEKRKNINL